MKMNSNIKIFILAGLIAMQPIMLANSIAADTKQLDSYFTRLKRGLKCYIKRTPCSKEDKELVENTASLLLIVLGAGLWLTYAKPWIKTPSTDENLAIYKNILQKNLDNIKTEIANLEQQGKKLSFGGFIRTTLRQIAEVQTSKQILQQRLVSTKRPLHIDLIGETFASAAAYQGRIAKNTMEQLTSFNQQEIQLKEIAKFFISKAGRIGYGIRSELPKLKIDAETLKELGLRD